MGKSLALLWNNFLLLQVVWVKNEKIHFSKEKKNGFERGLKKQKKCMWLQTVQLDLKNTEQLKFSLMVYFYAFLKV